MPIQNPVIVVPGIQGTGLEDFYPLPPEEVWSTLRAGATAAGLGGDYLERIALHPDDLRYEAVEPARVQPTGALSMAYRDLIDALRHDLSEKADKPTPVFPFGYDWRQDCQRSADLLSAFIDEVIERTWLLPHYRGDKKSRQVDLVGHSMGGLVIADCIARHGGARVRKVVTMATPFQGSIDAVKKLTTGMGTFSDRPPRDREREAARTIPAIYQLLPTYPNAITSSAGLATDLLELGTWQPSILATIAEFIRLRKGVIAPKVLFQQLLDCVATLRKTSSTKLKKGALPVEWFAIVGVGVKTSISADVISWPKTGKGKPSFDFPEAVDDWGPSSTGQTGDGTVPFGGARAPFLDDDQLLCLSPGDFGGWELADRAMGAANFHVALPGMNVAQRLAIKFLRPQFGGDVWGRAAPGVTKPRWPVQVEVRGP